MLSVIKRPIMPSVIMLSVVMMNVVSPYYWPPCTSYFRLTSFSIENIIYFFTKQATLMMRSTVLSLPPQLVSDA
jgi:hypothetical protein